MTLYNLYLNHVGPRVTRFLEEAADKRIPLGITLKPWLGPRELYEDPRIVSFVRTIEKNGGVLGQEGSDRRGGSYEEQLEFMYSGRTRLSHVFGVTPCLFVPFRHRFNGTTLEAATSAGYDFFADSALIQMYPYMNDGMMIVPETRFELTDQTSVACYVRFGERGISRKMSEIIFRRATSFNHANASHRDGVKVAANGVLKVVNGIVDAVTSLVVSE